MLEAVEDGTVVVVELVSPVPPEDWMLEVEDTGTEVSVASPPVPVGVRHQIVYFLECFHPDPVVGLGSEVPAEAKTSMDVSPAAMVGAVIFPALSQVTVKVGLKWLGRGGDFKSLFGALMAQVSSLIFVSLGMSPNL